VSAAGFLLFMAVAIASFAGPRFFERHAKQVLVERLREEIGKNYPALAPAGALEGLAIRLQAGAVENRRLLESRYPHAVGVLLESLCKHDCGDRTQWAALVRDLLQERLERLESGLERVRRWTQGRFDELIDRILRDVRVFALTNTLMFLLAFLAVSSSERPPRAL